MIINFISLPEKPQRTMQTLRMTMAFALLFATACSKDSTDGDQDTGLVDSGNPDTADTSEPSATKDIYAFDSAFDGASSVSYTGQSFRHLLMSDMQTYLSELTARLEDGSNPYVPQPGEVAAALDFYFSFDGSTGGEVPHSWTGAAEPVQTFYEDVNSGKNLVTKLAGNDAIGQHKNWSTDFVGWAEEGVSSPESLVRHWFDVVDAQAVAWSQGNLPIGLDRKAVTAVYLTPEGHNLQQLLQKFLGVGIAFSQGADDYMDDDVEGKGLNSPHLEAKEGKNFTELEHSWDEGFGYFGAAQSYGQMSDEQIKAGGSGADANGDGLIDLITEVNWGHSVNAAKRDLGAMESALTNYTAEAWEGFVLGRELIAETAGIGLSAEQVQTLAGHRDQAIAAWEKALAATVVHYINKCIQDLNPEHDLDAAGLATHWSELKGFALGFQFNPRSPMEDHDFDSLHQLIGTAPTVSSLYSEDLLSARELIMSKYPFDAANSGDEKGENGW
jgi:hypothetical protein